MSGHLTDDKGPTGDVSAARKPNLTTLARCHKVSAGKQAEFVGGDAPNVVLVVPGGLQHVCIKGHVSAQVVVVRDVL
jgi:hypothetical protein